MMSSDFCSADAPNTTQERFIQSLMRDLTVTTSISRWTFSSSMPTFWLVAFWLTGIEVVKRLETDRVAEADLSSWKTENKEANRKDVGHLVEAWKTKNRFYWAPGGSQFLGLDSVYLESSRVCFVQVKTGNEALSASRWIEDAFLYSKLLLDALGSPKQITVTILIGLGVRFA